MLGVVVSFVREKMWLLASYAVVPGAQGLGLGRALLAPALEHGKGSLRGMLNASNDPKAVRRYHDAGFRLYPQMFLRGTPDRSTIPVVEKVREGSASDIDLMDSLDRRTRGAAHGADHEILLEQYRLVVSDTVDGQGYAYLDDGVALLAATDRRTAARLMWEAIASSDDVLIGHITPGERLGGRGGARGAARARPGRLPGAAAHEAAEAVPPPRRPDVSRGRAVPTMSP